MSGYDDNYNNPYGSSGYGDNNQRRRRSTNQQQFQQGSKFSRSSSSSDYGSYRDGRSSTYDRYRSDNARVRQSQREGRGNTARRQNNGYASAQSSQQAQPTRQRSAQRYSEQATYSRYESGARYAEAARRRSNPYSAASGMAGSRNYSDKKKRGFSFGLSLPFLGGGSKRSGRSGLGGSSYARRGINFSAAKGPIIGIVTVALACIVFVLLWSNRQVKITLNGEETSVRNGSTISQLINQAELELTPGNLISVSGNKLEDGAGYLFLFKLNDEEQDGTATDEYRVGEGDNVVLEDGRDRTEEYDVVVEEEQPKLEMGGDSWGNITYISQWPKVGKYEMRTGKQSGETARGDTLQEVQNCIVTVHQISPDDGKKLVCLTFDDGPAESYTEKYLEILDTYGIKATFFNLGQNVEEYPSLAKKIVEQGSEIMSHTYQHQQLSTLDAASLQSEFSNAFNDIESNVGVTTTSFRPPYGDFTEKAWLNSGGLASVSVLWNMDSEDWRRAGVDSIVEKSTTGIFSGAIILMHDGGGNRDMDVEALPQIIEKLQAEGYEFVTVTELMKSDSDIPEDIANGDAKMPEDSTWPTEIADATTSDSADSTSA